MKSYADPLSGNTVNISDDEMHATLILCSKDNGKSYSADEIMAFLGESGIKSGIDKQIVSDMASKKVYNKEVSIAKGKKPEDGTDGYFDFHFKTKLSNKPRECEDGSVDYSEIDFFIPVSKDAEIVTYHKCIHGMMGFTVTGKLLTAKQGREKPAIMGRGFKISDDNCHYYSVMDGQISYDPVMNRIMISEMLTVDSDLSIKEGNINFRGDVYIKGAVRTGMKVSASGSITVDGIVEAADLTAGKNILLRSGALGNKKGSISSGDSIVGRFFEKCNVNAVNDISCSYIMDSCMSAGKNIEVVGRKGLILAGETKAFQCIKSNNAGNEFGTITKIAVGVDRSFMERIDKIDELISKVESEIEVFQKGLENDTPMRDRIQMALHIKTNERIELTTKKEMLMQRMDQSSTSSVVISCRIFPGVQIVINDDSLFNQKALTNVTYRKLPDHIGIFKN